MFKRKSNSAKIALERLRFILVIDRHAVEGVQLWPGITMVVRDAY